MGRAYISLGLDLPSCLATAVAMVLISRDSIYFVTPPPTYYSWLGAGEYGDDECT